MPMHMYQKVKVSCEPPMSVEKSITYTVYHINTLIGNVPHANEEKPKKP